MGEKRSGGEEGPALREPGGHAPGDRPLPGGSRPPTSVSRPVANLDRSPGRRQGRRSARGERARGIGVPNRSAGARGRHRTQQRGIAWARLQGHSGDERQATPGGLAPHRARGRGRSPPEAPGRVGGHVAHDGSGDVEASPQHKNRGPVGGAVLEPRRAVEARRRHLFEVHSPPSLHRRIVPEEDPPGQHRGLGQEQGSSPIRPVSKEAGAFEHQAASIHDPNPPTVIVGDVPSKIHVAQAHDTLPGHGDSRAEEPRVPLESAALDPVIGVEEVHSSPRPSGMISGEIRILNQARDLVAVDSSAGASAEIVHERGVQYGEPRSLRGAGGKRKFLGGDEGPDHQAGPAGRGHVLPENAILHLQGGNECGHPASLIEGFHPAHHSVLERQSPQDHRIGRGEDGQDPTGVLSVQYGDLGPLDALEKQILAFEAKVLRVEAGRDAKGVPARRGVDSGLHSEVIPGAVGGDYPDRPPGRPGQQARSQGEREHHLPVCGTGSRGGGHRVKHDGGNSNRSRASLPP